MIKGTNNIAPHASSFAYPTSRVMSGVITGPHFLKFFNSPSALEVGTMVAVLEIGAFSTSDILDPKTSLNCRTLQSHQLPPVALATSLGVEARFSSAHLSLPLAAPFRHSLLAFGSWSSVGLSQALVWVYYREYSYVCRVSLVFGFLTHLQDYCSYIPVRNFSSRTRTYARLHFISKVS